jgi:hypothetical protein
MPFILHRNQSGITEPRFQCDHCGKPIDDARSALLLWDDDYTADPPNFIPLLFCRNCEKHSGHRLPFSMGLDTAIIFLLHNSGMTPKRIKEQTRIASLLGSLNP